jgi:tripartite ATP-independent transporter DctP family solute receptor
MGHVTNPGSVFDQAAHKFADLVKEKTAGDVEISVFPAGQLGQEREVMEGMPLGIVDLYIFGTSTLTSIAPEIGDSDLPYLFRDKEHAGKVLEGAVGQAWLKPLEKRGIIGLGWGAGGFRSSLNRKQPITKASDFSGLKFRIAGGPVYLAMYRALGANAIQMTWSEVYTAMQQGVIDGLECPPNVMLSSKLNEVGKYLTLDEHTYSALVFGMAAPSFNRLSPQQRTVFFEAGKEAGRFMRDLAEKLDAEAIVALRKDGVEVDKIDKAPLIKAMAPVYKELAKNPKLVETIQATK